MYTSLVVDPPDHLCRSKVSEAMVVEVRSDHAAPMCTRRRGAAVPRVVVVHLALKEDDRFRELFQFPKGVFSAEADVDMEAAGVVEIYGGAALFACGGDGGAHGPESLFPVVLGEDWGADLNAAAVEALVGWVEGLDGDVVFDLEVELYVLALCHSPGRGVLGLEVL